MREEALFYRMANRAINTVLHMYFSSSSLPLVKGEKQDEGICENVFTNRTPE